MRGEKKTSVRGYRVGLLAQVADAPAYRGNAEASLGRAWRLGSLLLAAGLRGTATQRWGQSQGGLCGRGDTFTGSSKHTAEQKGQPLTK